ncbi:hypothetical protein O181_046200 [Austropuccinia psidii MF-1]|uniref:Uncharacterized protein n=1 Tax=Austropuccinia psidii MF-1 TaxID=1389203 RepID=A0A9Q3HLY2_9BASI|nr:hypothetical protein [Austropuccinia psidii MF-1]
MDSSNLERMIGTLGMSCLPACARLGTVCTIASFQEHLSGSLLGSSTQYRPGTILESTDRNWSQSIAIYFIIAEREIALAGRCFVEDGHIAFKLRQSY